MSARAAVSIATHYADSDDMDHAMQGLLDREARDRADGALSEEVGCGRPGDAPARRCVCRFLLVRVNRP
jgi:hypothetical protein